MPILETLTPTTTKTSFGPPGIDRVQLDHGIVFLGADGFPVGATSTLEHAERLANEIAEVYGAPVTLSLSGGLPLNTPGVDRLAQQVMLVRRAQ